MLHLYFLHMFANAWLVNLHFLMKQDLRAEALGTRRLEQRRLVHLFWELVMERPLVQVDSLHLADCILSQSFLYLPLHFLSWQAKWYLRAGQLDFL